MILLIDNYDSFTHNLYQLIAALYPDVHLVRNDKITVDEIAKMPLKAIILSPGPGHPEESGICLDVIARFAPSIPILGVCLGHQAIGLAFGAIVNSAPEMLHGKKSSIFHCRKRLFQGVTLPLAVGRYHSLVIDKTTLPSCLCVEAEDKEGVIMAVKHLDYPCFGVQFHPESILTSEGESIIRNFLKEVGIC